MLCNCDFSEFRYGLGEEFPTLSKRAFEVIVHFQSTYLCEGWFFSMMIILQSIDLDQ